MTPEEPRPPTRGTPGAPGEDVVSDDDEAYQRGWNIADAQILEHDRAALLAKLAYEDRPPLGRRPVPWTPVHRREWTDWARRILDRLLPHSSQPAPDAGPATDRERLAKALQVGVGPKRIEDYDPADFYRDYADAIAAEYDRLALPQPGEPEP